MCLLTRFPSFCLLCQDFAVKLSKFNACFSRLQILFEVSFTLVWTTKKSKSQQASVTRPTGIFFIISYFKKIHVVLFPVDMGMKWTSVVDHQTWGHGTGHEYAVNLTVMSCAKTAYEVKTQWLLYWQCKDQMARYRTDRTSCMFVWEHLYSALSVTCKGALARVTVESPNKCVVSQAESVS